MKTVIKELLKTVLVFVLCFIIIYFPLTIKDFFAWCHSAGVKPFRNGFETIEELDVEAINEYGKGITNFVQAIEEGEKNYELEEGQHYTTEYFDPVSYAVFSDLQQNIHRIVSNNVRMSLFLSAAITVGYIVITKRKMNNVLKFVLGYIVVLAIVPPIYMYSYTDRFWSFKEIYLGGIPKAFYIVYTIVFVLMFAVNFKVNSKLTDELNEMLKNNEYTKKSIRKKIVIIIALIVIVVLIVTFVKFVATNYQNYNIFKASINKVRNIELNGNYYYEVLGPDTLDYKMWVKGNKVKVDVSFDATYYSKYYSSYRNKVLYESGEYKTEREIYYIDFKENKTYCVNAENKIYQVKNELPMRELKLIQYPKTYRVFIRKPELTFSEYMKKIKYWSLSTGWTYDAKTNVEKTHNYYNFETFDVDYQIDERISINKETLLPVSKNDFPFYDEASTYNKLEPDCVKDEDVTFNNMNEYTITEEDGRLFKLLK